MFLFGAPEPVQNTWMWVINGSIERKEWWMSWKAKHCSWRFGACTKCWSANSRRVLCFVEAWINWFFYHSVKHYLAISLLKCSLCGKMLLVVLVSRFKPTNKTWSCLTNRKCWWVVRSVSAFTVWGGFSSLHHSVKNNQHFSMWGWSSFQSSAAAHIRNSDSTVRHLMGNVTEKWRHKLRNICSVLVSLLESSALTALIQGGTKPWAVLPEGQIRAEAAPSRFLVWGMSRAELSDGAGLCWCRSGHRGWCLAGERLCQLRGVCEPTPALFGQQAAPSMKCPEAIGVLQSFPPDIWGSSLTAVPQGTVAFPLMQKAPGCESETTSALWIFFPQWCNKMFKISKLEGKTWEP